MKEVKNEARVITKTTANPMPMAESIFLETPMKGHNPRNWVKMKLLMNTKVMMMPT